jgi:endonuclease YncB( thermonuclease family)
LLAVIAFLLLPEPTNADNANGLVAPGDAVVRVIDGDTFTLRLPEGDVSVRPAGYDSAEIGWRCQCPRECALAFRSREELVEILSPPARITIKPIGTSWGRVVAHVFVDGESLTERMMATGLVRRWDGKRRSWCPQ